MQMQQQKMRTRMREKYGNPQEMDSTQRRKARQEVMSTRRALMEEKTEEVGMSPERLGAIMQAARRDSVLRRRVQSAVRRKRQAAVRSGSAQGGPAPDTTAGSDTAPGSTVSDPNSDGGGG
jgi:hypothetical protein